MSTTGTLTVGSLVLTNQTITATDVGLADIRIADIDLNGTSRLRTATQYCVFDFNHNYDKNTALFGEIVSASNASSTWSSNNYVSMSVSGANGRVVRQSYLYVPYCPGSTQLVMLGGVLSTQSPSQPTSIRSRIGIFDDASDKTTDSTTGNGFFFQLFGASLSVVMRTSTSGASQTDTVVSQSSFSEDKLDGTGSSTLTFLPGIVQTFVIDLTGVGNGVVRMGIQYKNEIIYFHVFQFTTVNVPFVGFMNLPIRYEIQETSGNNVSDSLRMISGGVWSEGGIHRRQRMFSASTGSTAVVLNTTTKRPLISLSLKTSAIRSCLLLSAIDVLVDAGTLLEVYYGCTLTGSSFASTDSKSRAQVDTSATAVSGGTLIKSQYSNGKLFMQFPRDLETLVTADIAGTAFVVTLCGTKIESVSSNVFASIEWIEYS